MNVLFRILNTFYDLFNSYEPIYLQSYTRNPDIESTMTGFGKKIRKDCASVAGDEHNSGIQARRDRGPMGVGGGTIVDIDNVDFLKFSPLYVLAVEVCDAVGRQVRHFDAQMVLALAEHALGYIKDERNGPRTAEILVVQIDARALAYVAEVKSPGSAPQVCLREAEVALVDARSHELRRLLVEALPGAEAVDGVGARDSRRALDEREAP